MADQSRHRLYAVHASHPCVAVEHALALKQQRWSVRQIIPPLQVVLLRRRFGGGTVPAIAFANGERVQGSMAIMRRLDELYPEPPLYAPDAQIRAQQGEAEAWGDTELQMMTRRILFTAFRRMPSAMHSYQEGAKIRFPRWMTRMVAPLVIAGEHRVHNITDEVVRQHIADLPEAFDRIDAWIDAGVLGQEQVTAADLQISSSVRLMLTMDDIRSRFGGRPAAALALRLFPQFPGAVPAGVLW